MMTEVKHQIRKELSENSDNGLNEEKQNEFRMKIKTWSFI